MLKPKLVYNDTAMSLRAEWILPLAQEYFDVEIYDPAKTYNYASTLMIVPRNFHNNLGEESTDTGLRFAIDNLWESFIDSSNYVIQNKNWFWYNECLCHQHWEYDQYTPAKTYTKLALMPMHKRKLHRTQLLEKLTTVQDQLIWSYVEAGRQLPRDVDLSQGNGQRHFDPAWYDNTYFSIVVETAVDCDPLHPVFITEKTYKPMAFWHPFVIYGNSHTLCRLHDLGFETFDNLFDQSYDTVVNPEQRADAVVAAVQGFVPEPYSTLTQNKLAHNHAHFFDTELVKHCIRNEILEPLLHYAETQ